MRPAGARAGLRAAAMVVAAASASGGDTGSEEEEEDNAGGGDAGGDAESLDREGAAAAASLASPRGHVIRTGAPRAGGGGGGDGGVNARMRGAGAAWGIPAAAYGGMQIPMDGGDGGMQIPMDGGDGGMQIPTDGGDGGMHIMESAGDGGMHNRMGAGASPRGGLRPLARASAARDCAVAPSRAADHSPLDVSAGGSVGATSGGNGTDRGGSCASASSSRVDEGSGRRADALGGDGGMHNRMGGGGGGDGGMHNRMGGASRKRRRPTAGGGGGDGGMHNRMGGGRPRSLTLDAAPRRSHHAAGAARAGAAPGSGPRGAAAAWVRSVVHSPKPALPRLGGGGGGDGGMHNRMGGGGGEPSIMCVLASVCVRPHRPTSPVVSLSALYTSALTVVW